MTLEQLEALAITAGVSPLEIDEWTWGELCAAIDGWQRRERQRNQANAVIAYRQAGLIASYFGDSHKNQPVYDVFPFWTEEEKAQIRLAQAKANMQQWAARKITKKSTDKGGN